MSISAVKWAGRKRRKKASGNIILEDNVVDIVEPTDIEIKSSEIELVNSELTDGANVRKERRQERKNVVPERKEMMEKIPAIIMPISVENTSQIPNMNRAVICHECAARFEVSMGLKMIKCPICDARIDF